MWRAWQAEFDRQGLPFRPTTLGDVDPAQAATVEFGERAADLRTISYPFRLSLRTGRMNLLHGLPPDLATATGVAGRWLRGERPGRIAAAWPFLGSVAQAEARERGDRREAKWLWMYENQCDRLIENRLAAFVALAFHEPRLRALFPFTSHFVLRFEGVPIAVEPAAHPGRYLVHVPGRRAHDETDAATALRLVLNALPAAANEGAGDTEGDPTARGGVGQPLGER
ncbi:DUF6193 family natural product biosynthesis protein [Paractinoplanes lichenicola]|uniref:Uncharacterized protein n=1 Tax=Paractinoplanes lichenicola TaxID=2802976 RepID=A0ABS1VI91_9ACTN|nr:DUF6193 family natural product biosynthesis protein [Actinoplanes lichenicola]MBL7253844.1 hypothetical protein [Actinoplanes lichenicola]